MFYPNFQRLGPDKVPPLISTISHSQNRDPPSETTFNNPSAVPWILSNRSMIAVARRASYNLFTRGARCSQSDAKSFSLGVLRLKKSFQGPKLHNTTNGWVVAAKNLSPPPRPSVSQHLGTAAQLNTTARSPFHRNPRPTGPVRSPRSNHRLSPKRPADVDGELFSNYK